MHEIIKMSTLNHTAIAKELGVSRQFIWRLIKENKPIPNRHKPVLYKLIMNNFIDTIEKNKKGIKILSKMLVDDKKGGINENSK
tara:strand:- start:117 stop:368 length:252 start_codon:yes stop_codon:yes gene_type:complete